MTGKGWTYGGAIVLATVAMLAQRNFRLESPAAPSTPKPVAASAPAVHGESGPSRISMALSAAAAAAAGLRNSMRDPRSFEVGRAKLTPDWSTCMTYRARNGFGGMNAATALVLPSGDVRVDEASKEYQKLYAACASGPGIDVANVVRERLQSYDIH